LLGQEEHLFGLEKHLSYSLAALSVMGLSLLYSYGTIIQLILVNSMVQLVQASQAQAFTFLVRDQRLGANVASAQGPTGLGKYQCVHQVEKSFLVVKQCVSGI
jgi:hypothetical protein